VKLTVVNSVAFCEHGTAVNPVCEKCRLENAASESEPAPLESLIEAECTKILEQDGWRSLRTDPVSDRGRGKGFGEVGMADHLYIRYQGRFRQPFPDGMRTQLHCANVLADTETLWIEFKRLGEKPKKHQRAWHIKERARGALTLIAGEDFPATIEGFRQWYGTSGLMRHVEVS
jgi:hypothetical protein